MKRFVAIAAGLSLATLSALGQAGQDKMPKFEELDADQDGQITAAEAKVHEKLTEIFESIDVDENGALNADEYQKLIAPEKKM